MLVLTFMGSTSCYLFSWAFGGVLLDTLQLRSRLAAFGRRVERSKREGTLWFYLMSVRAVPMCPHWFINITSPWVGVPLLTFTTSMPFGKLPYVWVTVSAGSVLAHMGSEEVVSWADTLRLLGLAILSLSPTWVMRYCFARPIASPWQLLFGDDDEEDGRVEAGGASHILPEATTAVSATSSSSPPLSSSSSSLLLAGASADAVLVASSPSAVLPTGAAATPSGSSATDSSEALPLPGSDDEATLRERR